MCVYSKNAMLCGVWRGTCKKKEKRKRKEREKRKEGV
jgi:hypothetical protein